MKADILLDAIGLIKEEFIYDAKAVRKAKRYSWTRWVAVAACLCVVGLTTVAAPALQNFFEDWGGVMNENATSSEGSVELYAMGETVSIYKQDVEQAKDFYMLTGMEERAAAEQAVMYVAEREVLYQAALDNGYEATEQEVRSYIEELKEVVNSADNKEDAQTVIEQFATEEDYWNYQFTVYQKSLPIQNYVRDMEQKYKLENIGADDEDWLEYFENWKAQLVEQEHFQILGQ